VLLAEVVELLRPVPPGLLVDATVGLGGHARAMLEAHRGLDLLGIDRDPDAIAGAAVTLASFGDRVRLVAAPFADLPRVLDELGGRRPTAVLADLGCSSLQLDQSDRGFAFSSEGPLDMRMGPDADRTAAEILRDAEEAELMGLFRDYGEERRARAVARAITRHRQRHGPLQTTRELAELVSRAVGRSPGRAIHPATRVFQALRIAVNDELGQLESFLEPAVALLAPEGRIAMISFHSLEDRIVKHTLRRLAGSCTCPPSLPQCACGARKVIRILTPKPVRPSAVEVASNPRSRSARLRAASKIGGPL
jgi:16S rRNA (cytosine1402-N4)-methyltransferase